METDPCDISRVSLFFLASLLFFLFYCFSYIIICKLLFFTYYYLSRIIILRVSLFFLRLYIIISCASLFLACHYLSYIFFFVYYYFSHMSSNIYTDSCSISRVSLFFRVPLVLYIIISCTSLFLVHHYLSHTIIFHMLSSVYTNHCGIYMSVIFTSYLVYTQTLAVFLIRYY